MSLFAAAAAYDWGVSRRVEGRRRSSDRTMEWLQQLTIHLSSQQFENVHHIIHRADYFAAATARYSEALLVPATRWPATVTGRPYRHNHCKYCRVLVVVCTVL